MISHLVKLTITVLTFLNFFNQSFAQDDRAQFPPYLANAYFGANVGYITYPFSNDHLEPGFVAGSVTIPYEGVRLMLYGRHINEYLSMQITYMRPVLWVLYHDLNGLETRNSVWMNIAGLTIKPKLPLSDKFTLFGEFGLSIVTRHGFKRNGTWAVKDANYASILAGGGLKYHLNDRWDLLLHGVYTPENKKNKQPYTVFFAPGFQYNMRPLSEEKLQAKKSAAYHFPKNHLMIGYTTNALGYGVNAFFSEGTIPVFWGGAVEVERGFSVNYQRNVFHGRRFFSLDFGGNLAVFETRDIGTKFFGISVYPLARFTLLRTQPADFFFFYAAGGPTFLSQAYIDGVDTGKRFTFYDYMGIGTFAGPERTFMAEIKIGHYSNGNLFPQNAGVKIPLTFSVGYTF